LVLRQRRTRLWRGSLSSPPFDSPAAREQRGRSWSATVSESNALSVMERSGMEPKGNLYFAYHYVRSFGWQAMKEIFYSKLKKYNSWQAGFIKQKKLKY
jgi:hypothetical protein